MRRADPEDLIAGVERLLTGGRWTPPGAGRFPRGFKRVNSAEGIVAEAPEGVLLGAIGSV